MRFACQSCGKAYNLPEEKIADKSNVKLKCRVCGAIVEVKRQGEVVAAILAEGEIKRTRLSEAPAPLTSMMPDDSDDATHAIAVSDQILSEVGSSEDAASALMGHVKSALAQRGLAPLPPPPATGFGSVPGTGYGSAPAAGYGSAAAAGYGSAPAAAHGYGSPPPATGFGSPPPPGFGVSAPAGFAPTPVPPPLSMPEPPRPEAFSFPRADAPPLPPGLGAGPGSPPPPLPEPGGHAAGLGAVQNGSNGMVPRFGDAIPLPDEPLPAPLAPIAMAAGGVAAMSASAPGDMGGDMGSYAGPLPVEPAPRAASSDDTTKKMLAALATGILIGFIIARLFF